MTGLYATLWIVNRSQVRVAGQVVADGLDILQLEWAALPQGDFCDYLVALAEEVRIASVSDPALGLVEVSARSREVALSRIQ
jgi:hypothetical protein